MLPETFNLKQVIDFSNRTGVLYILMIDNLFLDKSRIGNFQLLPELNRLSDHSGPVLILENLQVSTQTTVHKYEMKQINEDAIQNFQLPLENEN
jgi:hypothetical protein